MQSLLHRAGGGTPLCSSRMAGHQRRMPKGSKFVPQMSSDADPQVRRVGILAGCRVQSACAHGAEGTPDAMKPLAPRPPRPAARRGLRGDTDRLLRRTRDTSTQGSNPEEGSDLRCGGMRPPSDGHYGTKWGTGVRSVGVFCDTPTTTSSCRANDFARWQFGQSGADQNAQPSSGTPLRSNRDGFQRRTPPVESRVDFSLRRHATGQ